MAAPELVQLDADGWRDFRDLRLASLADAPEAFGSTYADWVDASEERWRARLTDVPLTVVARDDTGLVGVVSGVPAEGHVELISMWVAPEWRGQGVGEALVNAVLDESGGRSVRLRVMAGNQRALDFYARMGFVLVSDELDAEGTLTMRRAVSPAPTAWPAPAERRRPD